MRTTTTELTQEAEPEKAASPLTRRRKIAVWVLIVLSTTVLLVGALTVWVKREVLDTNKFTASTTELMRNPKVRGELAAFLSTRSTRTSTSRPIWSDSYRRT